MDVEDELLRLGDTVLATTEGARAVALELCRGFDTKFVENIEGGEVRDGGWGLGAGGRDEGCACRGFILCL